jgi:hypothetical protein
MGISQRLRIAAQQRNRAPACASAAATAPPIPRDAPVTTATLPPSEKTALFIAALSDVRTPAAEFRDVGGARRGVRLAYKSGYLGAVLQFDLADP